MTTYSIPQPEGSTWDRWVSDLIAQNPIFANQVAADLPWEDAAGRLLLIVPQAPRPDFFSAWQAWAEALKQALQS